MIGDVAPEGVLAQLREIDFQADLFQWEGNVWLLGVWRPNNYERDVALGKRLERVRRDYPIGEHKDRLTRFYETCLNGFRLIDRYTIDSEHDFGKVISDFRQADFTARHELEEAFERKLDASDLDRRMERAQLRIHEKIHSEGRTAFKYLVKSARNFISPGVSK